MILWRTFVIILTLTSTERSFHLLQRGTSEGNAAYAIMAKHLEDFLDLSTGELRFYLQQRALTCHGNHADLAARALVAFEQNLPIKETAETLLFTLQREYSDILKCCGVTEDPLEMEGWEDNVFKWPKVHIGQILGYILENKAFSTDYIGQYKVRKAFSFFKSGFVHKVYVKTINSEGALLKAAVTPSQRIRDESHKVWVLIKLSGEVVCGYCTCTAGYSKCCNHVIALLYKIEFAGEHGFIDPSCTERACSWNNSSNKDIQPKRVQDMVIVEHVRSNANPKFSINNDTKRSFDPRPLAQRCITEEHKQCFLSKIRETLPGAVINITHVPTPSEDLPAPLCDLAIEVSFKKEGKSEEDVIREFSEKLTFSESSIRELEKASRGQSKSDVWKRQHKGRITASNFHDVNVKVKRLMRKTGQSVKCKVSPLLAKLLLPDDISELPSIRWGCMHEEDAAKAFLMTVGKQHRNGKLHSCGFFVSKSHPFLGASPDNIFSCDCCGETAMEYKCPYSVRGMLILEVWDKIEYLEMHEGKLRLKRGHRYYTQITGEMAMSGLERLFFVVWTGKGDPFVELIYFEREFWQQVLPNLVIFFKTYLQRVILGFRPLCYCPLCDSLCLEPEEFDNCNENSLQCESCSLWYHWGCLKIDEKSCPQSFICSSCNHLALNNDSL